MPRDAFHRFHSNSTAAPASLELPHVPAGSLSLALIMSWAESYR